MAGLSRQERSALAVRAAELSGELVAVSILLATGSQSTAILKAVSVEQKVSAFVADVGAEAQD